MERESLNIISRRTFVLFCAFGLLGFTAKDFVRAQNSPFKIRNFSRLARKRSVRTIGKKYLTIHPQEATSQVLEALIPHRPSDIGKQIARDFEIGDMVSIDGWLCSRTECRVCALAVITS